MLGSFLSTQHQAVVMLSGGVGQIRFRLTVQGVYHVWESYLRDFSSRSNLQSIRLEESVYADARFRLHRLKQNARSNDHWLQSFFGRQTGDWHKVS